MDTSTLTNALQSLNTEAFTWKFALYNTSRSQDGLELEWHLCEMQSISVHTNSLREYLLKKPVSEKPVISYSPFFLHKENIASIEPANELIRDQLADILLNIRNGQAYSTDEFVSGVIPATKGYAFYGERVDEDGNVQEQLMFMRRGNPFQPTAPLYIESEGKIVSCSKPILKLPAAVDFLMVGGVCYFLSAAIGKDFSLEERHFAIAQKQMSVLADASIVSDYERLEECVMKDKNARKFSDFDKKILEHITRIQIVDREEFLSTYGITIDNEGRIDTSNPDQCELVVDLLCGRSCLDPLGRLSVVSNIAPRE